MFEFILENYGPQIFELICTIIIVPVFTYLGFQLKQYLNTKEKQAVAKTVCEAIQQIYKDLSGEEKKQMALQNIEAMLAEKGITITALEMEMLIEAAVFGFKKGAETPALPETTINNTVVGEANNYTEAVAAALNGGVE